MRVFKFRLEKLLEFREKQEEAAALALSEARRETTRRKMQVESLLGKLRDVDAVRLNAQLEGVWPDVFEADRVGKHILKDLEYAKERLAAAMKSEEQARLDVVDRMKSKEIVSKLKVKAKEIHDKEVSTAEQKEADDIANSRYGKEV